jgi:hypothetical protein
MQRQPLSSRRNLVRMAADHPLSPFGGAGQRRLGAARLLSLAISPAARSRSPPCRYCGCRSASTPADRANREQRSRRRNAGRSPQDRARPGDRTPCTRRSAGPRPQPRFPSVMGGPGGDFFRRSALGSSSRLGCRLRRSILPRERGSPHFTRVPSPRPPLYCRGLGDRLQRKQSADQFGALIIDPSLTREREEAHGHLVTAGWGCQLVGASV